MEEMYHFGTIREFQMPLFLQEVFFFSNFPICRL